MRICVRYNTRRLQEVDFYTCLVDLLQHLSVHSAIRAIELTPWMGKLLFADNPLCSDLGSQCHDPSPQ